MNKTINIIMVLLLVNYYSIGQSQFKKLWFFNLPPFGAPFRPLIVNQNDSSYIFFDDKPNSTLFVKTDLSGNILYHHFPGFDSYKLVSKPFLIDDKFYDFVGSYYSVLDIAGNLLNKYVFYNDSIMNHSNTGFSESIFEHRTCYASGAITFFDTIYHGYPLIIKADGALNVQWAHYITSLENSAFFDKTCLGMDGAIYSLIKYDSAYVSNDSSEYGIAKFDTSSGSLQWAKKYLKSPYIIKDIIPFDNTSVLLYGMNDVHPNGINPYWDDSLIVMRIDTGGNVM